jgi:hypothetical protein
VLNHNASQLARRLNSALWLLFDDRVVEPCRVLNSHISHRSESHLPLLSGCMRLRTCFRGVGSLRRLLILPGNEATRDVLISSCGVSTIRRASVRLSFCLLTIPCILNTLCSCRSLATSLSTNGKRTAFLHTSRPNKMASTTTTLITATSVYLHPRAQTTVPPQVIGYTSTFGVYSAWNCLTGTWYEVSGFGRCCPTTQGDCPVYTTCVEGSIVANDQFRLTCTGSNQQSECITGTVYESIGELTSGLQILRLSLTESFFKAIFRLTIM